MNDEMQHSSIDQAEWSVIHNLPFTLHYSYRYRLLFKWLSKNSAAA
jgi:hypothetical protein